MEEQKIEPTQVQDNPITQNPMAPAKPKKKGKGMLIGMIFLAVLAVAGISFGVWTMLDSKTQKQQLNDQITSLQTQLAEQKPTVVEDSETTIAQYNNPIIKSGDEKEEYMPSFTSSKLTSGENVTIRLKDGKIQDCYVYNPTDKECNITGLEGEVYKIIEFGSGQDNSNSRIGFIMTSGKVQYIPLQEAINNNDFSIRGTLNIEKYVVDAIGVNVYPTDSPVGGYGSTVFVMSDGTFTKFDESMLK